MKPSGRSAGRNSRVNKSTGEGRTSRGARSGGKYGSGESRNFKKSSGMKSGPSKSRFGKSGNADDKRRKFVKKSSDSTKGNSRTKYSEARDFEQGPGKKFADKSRSSSGKSFSSKSGWEKKDKRFSNSDDSYSGSSKRTNSDKRGYKKDFSTDEYSGYARKGSYSKGKKFDEEVDKLYGGKKDKAGARQEDRSFKRPSAKRRNYGFDKKKETGDIRNFTYDENKPVEELIRLNRYIANAGICSRREADTLIQSGAVSVNGVVITEMGFKVKPGDVVNYGGVPVKREKNVYVLLNKPKDYITTSEDERGRKTVLDLVRNACPERLYPVGRLDRNTTGVLLLTNDGDLTTKLTHPKFGVKKLYHVVLDKNLKGEHFEAIKKGVELEDGRVEVDHVEYVGDGRSKKDIGIEIHSGRNRVVRRLFEYLGYDVVRLDRVVFAGLTKKDLPRGRWRFLSPKEVAFLKMIK